MSLDQAMDMTHIQPNDIEPPFSYNNIPPGLLEMVSST
jgi:hypothetical protein